MKPVINRRDFLKLAGAVPLSLGLHPLLQMYGPNQPAPSGRKNVLIIVYDALSALNMPLYGYARATTPNMTRMAKQAIVYHNHYAAGNYTTPATASLLTGTEPWMHRAFQPNAPVSPAFAHKSIFQAFDKYYRIVYSHNLLVNTFFKEFHPDLNDFVPRDRLFLTSDQFVHTFFGHDEDIADVGWDRIIKKEEWGYAYSLFLSQLYEPYIQNKIANVAREFPLGLPSINSGNYFLLEDATDWMKAQLGRLPQPYLGYFHFLPPHKPSAPPQAFFGSFSADHFKPPAKPIDPLADWKTAPLDMNLERREYDEYILYLDRELGRLFDYLVSSGILENTWVVVTADHGELFERGFRGHGGPLFYEGVVRIPLLIFEPGRTDHRDVFDRTSAVDVLPTLLQLTGEDAVDWTEGTVMPPFAPASPQRPLYAMDSRKGDPNAPITNATAMLIKENYKLTYFFGYKELGEGVERVDLYDIKADPEELQNLNTQQSDVTAELLNELKTKLKEVNQPYE